MIYNVAGRSAGTGAATRLNHAAQDAQSFLKGMTANKDLRVSIKELAKNGAASNAPRLER